MKLKMYMLGLGTAFFGLGAIIVAVNTQSPGAAFLALIALACFGAAMYELGGGDS